jgi:hypothetical protein
VVHVEPLLSGVLSDINGHLSGDFHITGSRKEPLLYGSNVILDSLGLTIDYLQTHYTLTVPVNITPGSVNIQNATIYDAEGRKGLLNGILRHQHFNDINYDLTILPQNMLCMNTGSRHNDNFYGKVYATGTIQIKGNEQETTFNITAQPNANTTFSIPVNNSSQVKETNILSFVEPEHDELYERLYRTTTTTPTKQKMKFDITLTAAPEAEVQIIFNEKTGDIIRGRGSGNITLNIEPEIDKLDIYGDYSIEQGDYFFTMQNIISKKFVMEEGSRIAFNGDISKTILDITAVYKTKASLSTLIEDTTVTGGIRRNIECKINVTGNLFTPELSYNVDVLNLDPNMRLQVQSALNSEEKMTRQFLSLLTFNSFMPDHTSGIVNINLSNSATELLSNQLSNMLTQLNIPFDIGFAYNTSDGNHSAFDLAISTNLFDNRLGVVVNSTMGNSRTGNTNTAFTGDINIEWKIDPKGRFRAKAFTYITEQPAGQIVDQFDNSQRSGIGIVYQEDFTTFRELFQRRKKKKTATQTTN